MINQLHVLSDEIIQIRILQYNRKELKTENLGKCAVGGAFFKFDLYVISNTDTGVV
jgi:hypothetical protein